MPGDGDSFKNVATGDPAVFKAAWYNAVTNAAKKVLNSRVSTAGDGPEIDLPEGMKYVKNVSGTDVDRFGILTLSNALVGPSDNLAVFQNNPMFEGDSPDPTAGYGNFGVAFQPIADGAIGLMFVAGVCPVQVNFANADDDWADVDTDNFDNLASDSAIGGAFVLWKETGTGIKWALVRIGNAPGAPGEFWAKITASAFVSSGPGGPYTYSFTEQNEAGAGVFQDKPGGITGTAYNAWEGDTTNVISNHGPTIYINTIVKIKTTKDASGNSIFRFELPPSPVFPIFVKNATGSAGSFASSTTCNLTYDVYDLQNNLLGSTLSPIVPRIPTCAYVTPGDYDKGLAYIDNSGNLVLYSVSTEIPATAVLNSLTSYQIDGTTYKVQYKKTKSLVLDIGTEDASWTDAMTGEPC